MTVEDVSQVARRLPRAYEVLVRGQVKFRVGSIVWLELSHDQQVMGFAFPKDWRQALVESDPEKFMLPNRADLEYNWDE